MNEKLEPMSPMTQADTEQWIGEVEDRAWQAQASTNACRFVLGNLLAELQRTGLMDVRAFIARLQIASSGTDTGDRQTALGIQGLLQDLQLHFFSPSGSEGEGNPGGVFH